MEDINDEGNDYRDTYMPMQIPVPTEYVAALQFQKIYGNIDNWDYPLAELNS